MATKTNMDGLVGAHDDKTVIIRTEHNSCPRCKNLAIVKVAGFANNPSSIVLNVVACPHCGFWMHTGFVAKAQTSAIEYLKSYGFFVRKCRDNHDYVAMTLGIEPDGVCIRVRTDGTMQFDRIGGGGNFNDDGVKFMLNAISNCDTLDKSKTYLARWHERKKKLEIFCGAVPTISMDSPESENWENLLIRPNILGRDPREYDQFIGILMN